MTEPDDRYSEEVRRALSAAADLVVPAGDGLDRIRERVVHRPALFAWFIAYTKDLPHQILVSFRVAATGLSAVGSGGSSGPPPDGRRRPHFHPESSWVRPTLAAVGALAIVAIAATVILPRLTQPVTTSGYNNHPLGQSVSPVGGTSSNSSSQQNSSSGSPLTSKSPHSLITMPPPPTQCQTLTPSGGSSTSASPSPTDTTPSTYISPTPAPGPSQTVTPTPGAGPQSFANMIGEEQLQAATQWAAATTTCATQPPASQSTAPPTPPSPTSAPPTSTPPTSTPPTSTPPTSPPTSPPPSTPSPAGSVSPSQAPPLP